MPRAPRLLALATAAVMTASLAACSTSSGTTDAAAPAGTNAEAITIEHAYGTTTLPEKPERVATVAWANQEVPLALGVVPVGMAAATFGDDDGDGVLPWVSEKLEELDAEVPVLFDETDGIDFEAVANTEPDVILAAYSGLTQEDYDTLSEIAPVVAFPETAWGTPWREMIELNSAGMGMTEEGEQLIAELDQQIGAAVEEYPEIAGKRTMFMTHVDPTDLSEVSYYTTHDTRAMFFEDLGLATPESVATASAETDQFSGTISTEQADVLDDVDIIVTYGDDELVSTLEADPLLAQIPAVANEAIVNLPSTTPVGTAANPTPLSISWVLEDYLSMISEAAARS